MLFGHGHEPYPGLVTASRMTEPTDLRVLRVAPRGGADTERGGRAEFILRCSKLTRSWPPGTAVVAPRSLCSCSTHLTGRTSAAGIRANDPWTIKDTGRWSDIDHHEMAETEVNLAVAVVRTIPLTLSMPSKALGDDPHPQAELDRQPGRRVL